jgi:hypothetical protein
MAKINPKSTTLVATFVSPGVAAGAAGFVIVGGKIRKVEPRGPAFAKLTGVIAEIAARGARSR